MRVDLKLRGWKFLILLFYALVGTVTDNTSNKIFVVGFGQDIVR